MRPPHLKTIVLNQGGVANGWDSKIRNHGAFELAQQGGWAFTQLATQTRDAAARAAISREKVSDWVSVLPATRGLNPLSIAPNVEEYIFDVNPNTGEPLGLNRRTVIATNTISTTRPIRQPSCCRSCPRRARDRAAIASSRYDVS